MRKKYLRKQDFLAASAKQGGSVVWRSIIRCKELIRQGIAWTLGNDHDISFWKDNWLDNRSVLELLELHDQDSIDGNLKVSEFIENKKWNINKLHHYINNPDIIHQIIGIPISLVNITDSFCWGLSSTGEFTTCLLYTSDAADE